MIDWDWTPYDTRLTMFGALAVPCVLSFAYLLGMVFT
jgi:hypothetical protein